MAKKQPIKVGPRPNPDFYKLAEVVVNGELPASYDVEDGEIRIFIRDESFTTLVITRRGWRIE